ncbi:MAG: hypothetical protein QG567_2334 [Campylobacterota bacterium]|nr:hypothetical protein [Campylobacterota bacterium]
MKKIIVLVVFSVSLFAGADMCLYYHNLISASQQKAHLALERKDIDYAEAYFSEVVRNTEAAIVECAGIIPANQMQNLHTVRKTYSTK